MSQALRRGSFHNRLNRLRSIVALIKTALYYRMFFGAVGRRSRIFKPLLLSNPQFVFIGDHTMIRQGARIETLILDPQNPPSLIIGDNVNIEQNVHLICSSKIVIGDGVTITGNCAIVDTIHPFLDVDDQTKIGDRIDPAPSPVEIGAGTFIGFGTVILPNVRIGKNCVIGANCTVVRDVPDFSVLATSPSSRVMHYDFDRKSWSI